MEMRFLFFHYIAVKVKGWKGEKVKKWLAPFKGERVGKWNKGLRPLKVKRGKSEKVKQRLTPFKREITAVALKVEKVAEPINMLDI